MSKEESKMLQGISVLAMVCLHLFDNLNYSDLFTPLIMLKGYPLIFYFAQLSAKELLQKKTDKLIVSLLQFLDNSSFVYLDQRRHRSG